MQEVPLGGEDSTPLQLRLGGNVVKVTGYIDRIDRIGDRAIVVDYKTGSTANSDSGNDRGAKLPDDAVFVGGRGDTRTGTTD